MTRCVVAIRLPGSVLLSTSTDRHVEQPLRALYLSRCLKLPLKPLPQPRLPRQPRPRSQGPPRDRQAEEAVDHPPVNDMVVAAIKTLKERNGSSLQAIKKYIAANYKCDVAKLAPFLKKALKNGVEKGKFVQTKAPAASGSFKLKAEAKKAASEKKPKKAGEKKAKKATGEKKKATKKPAGEKKAKKPAGEKKAKKPAAAKKAKAAGAKAAKKAGGVKKAAAPKQKATKPSKTAAKKPKTPKPKKAAPAKKAAAKKTAAKK
ncbi:histone H1-like [Aedes aegypti]|uniref:Uncharacterized protein n=1 Tax=Aedes aegypti TaxID=7159 RepID=A0A6I8TUW5_AEDAE|nr:histone H1-like [Aedes aegypti]